MSGTTPSLNIGSIINQAWALTKKHFPVFLLLIILTQAIGSLPSAGYYGEYVKVFIASGQPLTETEWIQHYFNFPNLFTLILLYLIAVIGGWYLALVTYRMLHDVVEGKKEDLTAQLKGSFRYFLFFVGVNIVFAFSVAFGMFCCILPGIYLSVRWIFAPYIAANHPDIPFSDAFSRSWQMTKGHFWELFALGLIAIGINIIGLICCCVGIFVTSVISYMMYGLAYQALLPLSDEAPLPATE